MVSKLIPLGFHLSPYSIWFFDLLHWIEGIIYVKLACIPWSLNYCTLFYFLANLPITSGDLNQGCWYLFISVGITGICHTGTQSGTTMPPVFPCLKHRTTLIDIVLFGHFGLKNTFGLEYYYSTIEIGGVVVWRVGFQEEHGEECWFRDRWCWWERERERESYRLVVRRDAACRSKMGSTDSGLGGVGTESKLCEGVRERQICKSEEDWRKKKMK